MLNIKVPLYKQVQEKILCKIKNNNKEGDLLPTEPELVKIYGVSRTTLRKAIDELVTEGYVEKIQGRGTFVKSNKIVQSANSITSWTEEMKLNNKIPATKDLKIYKIKPSIKMKTKLNLNDNEDIICVERTRLADGEPIALLFNYLRAKFLPGFLEKGITRESLYEELEKEYNIILKEAQEQIKARLVADLEASKLNISPGDAVLQITRTTFLQNGTPFEMVEMINRSDKYEYHIKVSERGKNIIIK